MSSLIRPVCGGHKLYLIGSTIVRGYRMEFDNYPRNGLRVVVSYQAAVRAGPLTAVPGDWPKIDPPIPPHLETPPLKPTNQLLQSTVMNIRAVLSAGPIKCAEPSREPYTVTSLLGILERDGGA
jgi:hypothetical protein